MPSTFDPTSCHAIPPRRVLRGALQRVRSAAGKTALLPLAALVAGTAAAESTPYHVGASQRLTYHSNVNDAPGAQRRSDAVSTTTVRGGVDLPMGRQRVHASAHVNHSAYSDESQFDNTSYGVAAGVDWQTVGQLSGKVSLNSARHPWRLNPGAVPGQTRQTMQRSDGLSASVRLGGAARLGFEAGVGHRRQSYSAPEMDFAEYRSNSANAGVSYRFSSELSTSAGVAVSEGRYPSFRLFPGGPVIGDRSERRDVYFAASWSPTGNSSFDARLNVGRSEHEQFVQRNFSGVTGSLGWQWAPTGKLSISTRLSRDIGEESSVPQIVDGTLTFSNDISRITDVISVSARHQLTGKVSIGASASHARRDLVGFLSQGGHSTTTVLSLGASWQATRLISTGCDASRQRHDGAGTLTSNTFGCHASILLRL